MMAWLLALVWLVSAVVMAVAWAACMRARNAGFVDVVWAGLMAVSALMICAMADGNEGPRSLVALFGGVWGARLCLHLLHRVLHEPEDGRYQELRASWNGSPARFFAFFQVQAVSVALFSIPFAAAASRHDAGMTGWTVAAVATWLLSIVGEGVADRQLSAFRADPANRGRTCRAGLWSWSRHPNYFFEWLHWFTYVFLAVGSVGFWWSLTGPVVMYLFLHRVSGIPWTEAQSLRSRGDDYRRYQQEVSAFFPRPPRRG